MDQPDLDAPRHVAALRGLARINRISGSDGILWPPLAALARKLDRPVFVLDVATGSGDVPVRLWERARKAGVTLNLFGCDRSHTALECARRGAAARHAHVKFYQADAIAALCPASFDAVISSLFLHHLGELEAVQFLRGMRAAARHLVLVNDLRRGTAGLALAHLACRLLTRSPVVHVDGPRSVAAAFTPAELSGLAAEAGLDGATVERRWPCRMLLTWHRPAFARDANANPRAGGST